VRATRKKAAKGARAPAPAKPYRMPIPHERFVRMMTALLGHIRGLDRDRSIRIPGFSRYRVQRLEAGELLNESTAREIMDALHKLRVIYSQEAQRANLPNRREKNSDLQDAANAQWLMDVHGFDAASAVEMISGKRSVERYSVVRTQRNRNKKAMMLCMWPDIEAAEAALRRKKKTER
jgi:hypothetical protein